MLSPILSDSLELRDIRYWNIYKEDDVEECKLHIVLENPLNYDSDIELTIDEAKALDAEEISYIANNAEIRYSHDEDDDNYPDADSEVKLDQDLRDELKETLEIASEFVRYNGNI